METHLPHGQHGWESVTADFNAAMTDAGHMLVQLGTLMSETKTG